MQRKRATLKPGRLDESTLKLDFNLGRSRALASDALIFS